MSRYHYLRVIIPSSGNPVIRISGIYLSELISRVRNRFHKNVPEVKQQINHWKQTDEEHVQRWIREYNKN